MKHFAYSLSSIENCGKPLHIQTDNCLPTINASLIFLWIIRRSKKYTYNPFSFVYVQVCNKAPHHVLLRNIKDLTFKDNILVVLNFFYSLTKKRLQCSYNSAVHFWDTVLYRNIGSLRTVLPPMAENLGPEYCTLLYGTALLCIALHSNTGHLFGTSLLHCTTLYWITVWFRAV